MIPRRAEILQQLEQRAKPSGSLTWIAGALAVVVMILTAVVISLPDRPPAAQTARR